MAARERHALHERVLGFVEGPFGIWVLVVFALLEATVFPGPTEAMLIALVLARRERVGWYAAIAVAASVAGGIVGYHLGGALFETTLRPLFASYGYASYIDRVLGLYRGNAFIALASSGYTPIPYMLYTAMAGVADVPLGTFVGGSMIGRGLKYVPIAAIAYLLGPGVHDLLRRYGPVAALVVMLAVAVWLVLG